MATAYASHDSAYSAGGGSVTITKPTGLAENDLLIAFISEDGSAGGLNTPTDWTAIVNTNGANNVSSACFAKLASAGDAAAANFTFTSASGTANVAGLLYRVTGTFAGTANVYASVSQEGTDQSDDVYRYATGITPGVASSLLIMYTWSMADDTNDSLAGSYTLETSNPSWTERLDDDQDGSHHTWTASATANRTETTATGYYQVTFNTAGNIQQSIGMLVAVADTTNGSISPAVIDATAAVQAPTVTGAGNISPAVIDATLSVQAPTASTASPTIVNLDKPSAGTITNQNKPA